MSDVDPEVRSRIKLSRPNDHARGCVVALLDYLDRGAWLEKTETGLVNAYMPNDLYSVNMVLDADDMKALRDYAKGDA